MKSLGWAAPATLDEALALVNERNRPLAGGTDLIIHVAHGKAQPDLFVSLTGIAELAVLAQQPDGTLSVGANVTHRQIEQSPLMAGAFAALADAARLVGSIQIRNVATVGGNICNAVPSADLAPALLVFGAQVAVVSAAGRRRLALQDLFAGPSATVLGPSELVERFELPAQAPRTGSAYLRQTPRLAMDLAVVGVAARVALDEAGQCAEASVALGAVAPTPILAPEAARLVLGTPLDGPALEAAAEAAAAASRPISDVRGSAAYRREMVKVFTRRTLELARDRAEGRA
jgi:CO/xanthine dehydrogenase FAD-binding subunit